MSEALPVGRPTVLTNELQREICEKLRLMLPRETAAISSGISYGTFAGWMRRGRSGEEPYLQFFKAVERAEGEAETLALAQGEAIAKETKDASWYKWKLERLRTKTYGQRVRIHVEQELTDALERARVRYANDPARYEEFLSVIAGEGGAETHSLGAHGGDAGDSETVDATPALTPPAGVPPARR